MGRGGPGGVIGRITRIRNCDPLLTADFFPGMLPLQAAPAAPPVLYQQAGGTTPPAAAGAWPQGPAGGQYGGYGGPAHMPGGHAPGGHFPGGNIPGGGPVQAGSGAAPYPGPSYAHQPHGVGVHGGGVHGNMVGPGAGPGAGAGAADAAPKRNNAPTGFEGLSLAEVLASAPKRAPPPFMQKGDKQAEAAQSET